MAKKHLLERIVNLLLFVGVIYCCCCPEKFASAQFDGELQKLYQEMIPQFQGTLKTKLEKALREGKDFIELDSSQFREFRDHPANPFDGWGSIDPSKIDGIIRLQFETQPVRSRRPGTWERQSKSQLAELEPACAAVLKSTVKFVDGKKQLCYGIIVDKNGYVVTKASEIAGAPKLFCKTYDGRVLEAKIVNQDVANDLALVKIDANDLVPIVWTPSQAVPGTFLVSPDQLGNPIAMGVYSHVPRSLVGKNQAFLGVKPQRSAEGLLITEVNKNESADKAGIQAGDTLLTLDGEKMDSVTALVNAVRARRPGDKVVLVYSRNGTIAEATATLSGRNIPSEMADRLQVMNKFGAIPSQRSSEFPLVLQHDTPLLPEQCGGPLVDLDGRVVGVNIARAGRVDSYAIPASHMKTLVSKLVAPTIAQNNDSSERK